MGYYKPIPDSGDDAPAENLALNPGDKVFKNAQGNRITLRAGGTIEVQSTDLCRTYYIPSRNLINTVCQEMELETDGGSIDWTRDRDTQETVYTATFFDSLEPETVVVEERGLASTVRACSPPPSAPTIPLMAASSHPLTPRPSLVMAATRKK